MTDPMTTIALPVDGAEVTSSTCSPPRASPGRGSSLPPPGADFPGAVATSVRRIARLIVGPYVPVMRLALHGRPVRPVLAVVFAAAVACSTDPGAAVGAGGPASSGPATSPPTAGPVSAGPPTAGPVSASPTAGGTGEPTLGEVFRRGARGYGQVRPSVIDAAGGATAVLTGVAWGSWGAAEATGTGQAIYVPTGERNAAGRPEPADLTASDLGRCPDGVLAYRSLTWTFPAHPGTARAGFPDICSPSPAPVSTTLDRAVFTGYPEPIRGTQAWRLLGCDAGRPLGAVTAMGGAEMDFRSGNATVTRQVAVFAGIDDAVAEAQRLGRVARGCDGTTSPAGFEAPQVQDLGIGADAVLLRVPIVDGGQVAAVLRRGTAVALETATGSFAAGNDLEPLVRTAAAGLYQQLCPYQRGGNCPG